MTDAQVVDDLTNNQGALSMSAAAYELRQLLKTLQLELF